MSTKSTKSTPSTKSTKVPEAKVTKAAKPAKATPAKDAKPAVKADRPKLTAAYIKEMVAKGLSPLTGKPIRHYSREGKRYAGKAQATPAKPVTEKVEAKAAEATVTKPEAKKPGIPVLKAKKAPAKKA